VDGRDEVASVHPIARARYATCLAEERVLAEEVKELKRLLETRENEQAAAVERLEKARAFKPCNTFERMQQRKKGMTQPGNSSEGPGGSNGNTFLDQIRARRSSLLHTDDEEDDDEDYVSDDEEEQEEPAPPQPAHTLNPKSKEEVGEEQHTFDVVNAAMQVLVKEQEDQRRGETGSTGSKLAMSVLDRCFFEVREYMRGLVESMPQRGQHDDSAQTAPTNVIAGGSTQMGKTLFVTIGYLVAWFAECPLLCITTTVGGTKSLHNKVLKTLERLEPFGAPGISIFCMYLYGLTPNQQKHFGKKPEEFMEKGNLRKDCIAQAGSQPTLPPPLAPDSHPFLDVFHATKNSATHHLRAHLPPMHVF